jgi:hypothetical protein
MTVPAVYQRTNVESDEKKVPSMARERMMLEHRHVLGARPSLLYTLIVDGSGLIVDLRRVAQVR